MRSRIVYTLLLVMMITSLSFAQKAEKYNRWSVELGAGVMSLSQQYQTTNYFTNHFVYPNFDLGFRYMFNPKFGVKLDGQYAMFEDGEIDGIKSLPLKGNYLSTTLQGVANLTNIVDFRNQNKKLGVLLHGGLGWSNLSLNTPNPPIRLSGYQVDEDDDMISLVLGATLQYKLGRRVALTGDVSYYRNYYNRLQLNGNYQELVYLNSNVTTATLGLTFYLGKQKEHVDWYKEPKKPEIQPVAQDNSNLEERVAALEAVQPQVAVNYDDRIKALEDKVSTIDTKKPESSNKYIDQVIVYFDFNSDIPKATSSDEITRAIDILKKDKNAVAELVGYADQRGDADYNLKLALRRAQNVKNAIVKAGIDAARVSVASKGKEASDDSEAVRSTIRRVVVTLK